VTGVEPLADEHRRTTEAVVEHNRLIAEDERYLSTIVPTRDGVMVALRVT
jgi:predicted O-methyltransferase YrrM